jgi:hypothetical protein
MKNKLLSAKKRYKIPRPPGNSCTDFHVQLYEILNERAFSCTKQRDKERENLLVTGPC